MRYYLASAFILVTLLAKAQAPGSGGPAPQDPTAVPSMVALRCYWHRAWPMASSACAAAAPAKAGRHLLHSIFLI
nr:hypothetical protein [Hymenobacter sp. BRD67]